MAGLFFTFISIILSITSFLFWAWIFSLVLFAGLMIFLWLTNLRRTKKIEHENRLHLSTIESLEKDNHLKNQFFTIISHDLKEPFNGILGLSNYLIDEYDALSEKEKKEIAIDLNAASKNAFNLLNNLLNWAKTQNGTMVNHPVVIDARSIIDFALETVSNLAHRKQIGIMIDADPKITGFADENMVATIIRNLVTNAIKFSPRHSSVLIKAEKYKDRIVFLVVDQGIGFRSDEIDLLFRTDIHFQKKGTEMEPGSGIGLILCNKLAQLCKGKLWVVSEFDKGSTFFLTIPRNKP